MPQSNKAQGILKFGLALMGLAVLWWLAYYGQQGGVFAFLDVKLACLVGMDGSGGECPFFRKTIGSSVIPVYTSIVWWVGTVVTAAGYFIARQGKK